MIPLRKQLLLITLALAILPFFTYSSGNKRIQKMNQQTLKTGKVKSRENVTDKFIEIRGIELHYRDFGNTGAPPLLILHGLSGHAWEFDEVAKALSENFHVLSINQRGHGDSDWASDYSPELMADDIAIFIDALKLGKVSVIGHSMGGVNGWWLAARYPKKVNKLAILDINPAIICREDMPELWQNIFSHYANAKYPTLEEGVRDYLSFYNGTKEDQLRDFAINSLKQTEIGEWIWKLDANNLIKWIEAVAGSEDRQWELLGKIQSPTLIIYGGDSPYTDKKVMEKMANIIPDSQVVYVPDSGHDIHFDQFGLLMNSLEEFLNGRQSY